MIIEAGHDLWEVLESRVLHDDMEGLWLVGMDQDLRVLEIARACDRVPADLTEAIPELLAALDSELGVVRYYALAHADLTMTRECHHQTLEGDEVLHLAAELVEFRFLGRLIFGNDLVCSSVPLHAFRHYPHFDDLPRVACVAGPHSYDCDCVACAQLAYRLAKGRPTPRA